MDNILESESIQEAINSKAIDHMDKGRLCNIAKDAVQNALRKANESGENPLEDELEDIAVAAVMGAGPCPPQCRRCEYHKSKGNKAQGKMIPDMTGKCTRPTGLCTHITQAHKGIERGELAQAYMDDDPVIIPEITDERGAELTQAQNTAAAVTQAVMDAEEVFRDLGRIDAGAFFATVADSMMIQVFQKVKKTKAYKSIPIVDENGKVRPSQNLDEFCKVKLGKSYRRLQELSGNIEMLGSDLYESAERIGFRSKDYRALKALPPEEQAIVKEAIEAEDKDQVVDLLQDMAARHQAEKEAAKKETDDLTADLDARGKLLKDKAEKLEQTEEELYRLKSLPKDANLELKLAREEEATNELNKAFVTALGAFNEMLMQVDAITENENVSNHTKAYGFDQVRAFCIDVQAALGNYAIPVDFEEMVNPSWMKGEAKADLEDETIPAQGWKR